MNIYTKLITLDKEFDVSKEAIFSECKKQAPRPVIINGLSQGASLAYVTELLLKYREAHSEPALVIVGSDGERDKLAAQLEDHGIFALSFKPRDLIFYNISASHDCERERLAVLTALIEGKCPVIVTTPPAAASYTVPRELLSSLITTLRVGDEIAPSELCRRLDAMGFSRVELVEAAGQFAHRGGIVDFYTAAGDVPYRVEFFGDEIDRIVTFDVLSQRAADAVCEVSLSPALEVMLSGEAKERVLAHVRELQAKAELDAMKQSLGIEIATLEGDGVLACRDKYLDIIYKRRETLLSYMTSQGTPLTLVLGTAEGEELLSKQRATVAEQMTMLASRGLVSSPDKAYYLSESEYKAALSKCAVAHINPFAGVSGGELAGLFGFRCRRTIGYGTNNRQLFIEDLNSYVKGGYRVIITAPNKQGAEAVMDMLADEGFLARFIEKCENIDTRTLAVGNITVTTGGGEGYDLISPKVALLSTERDEGVRIMAEQRRRRVMKRAGGATAKIMSHNDLTPGDYVVHANYGIGLFEGIQSVRALGVTKDYITIKYAGTDKLFVPCDRLDMISKYIGERADDGTVRLSKMGGVDWQKTKARAKGAAKDIAKKLIKLYAERQNSRGFSFPPDSEMEDEFAASFEYEETEAQSAAIEEIKQDMMKPVPMNRLLLGDVGFGKTEVALRAAFKAIMGGKQVAILVPTTLLALQHYQTTLSRMRGYAVNVEMISRFRTPREEKRILEDTKRGRVDILIGTHKLLSKKVEFRRLGLLIVDEEQRFGVSQKEKLKEMSVGVDVLTLSATPIPRTLNMAINGISDMSVLEEPPGDRRPVQTFVLEHDEPVIFDAIRRELYRGGQVLYLFNNTDTISFVASKISDEIPEARVAYAHGKMERDTLEDIWQMLIRGEIDVLVCTTIIETGVDLPNANTLIIENADRMGLSQLHQIRGRVGRSGRQAYAYFTYRPGKALSEIATKRLSAIREYAEFGAGFKVALRDLEIRGAGNLLGAEQHGYIDSVGYELYVKLLNQAVAEEKGEAHTPIDFESTVDINVDAHIPERYIASSSHRMEMYKRISDIRTPEDRDDVYDEMTDRFGTMPKVTERLLSVALCRAISEDARIKRTALKGGNICFYTDKPDLNIWSRIFDKYRGRLMGVTGEAPIIYRLRAGEEAISALVAVLTDYFRAKKQSEDNSVSGE